MHYPTAVWSCVWQAWHVTIAKFCFYAQRLIGWKVLREFVCRRFDKCIGWNAWHGESLCTCQLLTPANRNAEFVQVANAINLVASLKFYLHLQFPFVLLIKFSGKDSFVVLNSALRLSRDPLSAIAAKIVEFRKAFHSFFLFPYFSPSVLFIFFVVFRQWCAFKKIRRSVFRSVQWLEKKNGASIFVCRK